uniref:DOG1 domain-containing protein n=1 Tax=Oryza punctata TaxID=4537 RepID=A0A0E0LDI8_ORYPU
MSKVIKIRKLEAQLFGLRKRRNPEGYDMPSDLDQALLLYFDGQEQDKPSTQEEPHKPLNFVKETLNIFPSQPMDGEPKLSSSGFNVSAAHRRLFEEIAGASGGGGKATRRRQDLQGNIQASASSELEGPKTPDPKTLRRLAQNREAARKSRLRKKVYIQQLETGRIRLAHLEQEIRLTRAQRHSDAALFNLEYERWQEAHHQVIGRLRATVEEHRPDSELQPHVDEAVSHYGVLMAHKARLVGADPIHLLFGLWKGAVEQCFLWIGDFRPSELIKVVIRHVEPLTEQQLAAVYSAQQAARREEDALDGALHALLRSLSDVVSSSDAPAAASSSSQQTPPVMYHRHHPPAAAAAMAAASFMGQYGCHNNLQFAMDKLASFATFLRQADEVRMRTLHALRRMLTVRQAARCFVAVDDYFGRLRALALFWTTTRQPAG